MPKIKPLALALAVAFAPYAAADEEKQLSEMSVRESRAATLVGNPTPQAEVTAEEIRNINVINVEDAVKYLPSLQIRKRYVGDRNSIIAARTTGNLQSARSLVYADGLLLSNLLGNSYGFPPRWNLIGSEEIDTIDVLYGPFSALLPGNSAGATILMTTRRPADFEAHARAQTFTQHFKLYRTDDDFDGHQEQGSAGFRSGPLSVSLFANHLDSHGQPMSFGTARLNPGAGGTAVTGHVIDRDPTNAQRVIVSAYGMDHTVQDTGKVRLAWDISSDSRLAFTYGEWRNDSSTRAEGYLRDASGNRVTSGNVRIDGTRYTLTASHFAPGESETTNRLYGLTFDSRLSPDWRLEAAGSLYQTPTDISRTAGSATSVGGTVSFGDDTGWRNLDLRAIWKPNAGKAGHTVSFGYHEDAYRYRNLKYNATRWEDDDSTTTLASRTRGRTRTSAWYGQEEWKFDPRWTLTAGLRHERWEASDGEIFTTALGDNRFPRREESGDSPKLSLAWQATPAWRLRASVGKAIRFPTVTELFQTETRGASTFISDPDLKPEKVTARDLTAEGAVAGGTLRFSLFHETIRDGLYSFTDTTSNTTRNQNVDKLRAQGAEAAFQASDVLPGVDLLASLTYVDSEVLKNHLNPASVGKRMIRLPDWRAALHASWRMNDAWTASLGYKYSGLQYNNPDNSDTHTDTYGGNSRFSTVDARLSYRFGKLMTAALGVDNLTNEKYYAFHPYPQRTYHAELRIDY